MLIAHKKFNPRKLSIHCDDFEIVGMQVSVPGQLNVFSMYTFMHC